jgi:hypothetical protein
MVQAVEAAKPDHVVYISLQRREHPKLKLFEVTDVENDTERDIKAASPTRSPGTRSTPRPTPHSSAATT